MDPHNLLTSDHRALRQQATDLRIAVDKNTKSLAELLIAFQNAVQKHFKREDAYYRILDNGKRLSDRELVHQLRNDHAAIVFTLESLAIRLRKNGVNPDWIDRFNKMMVVFLPHLDQEENTLFPIGKRELSTAELDSLSDQMTASE